MTIDSDKILPAGSIVILTDSYGEDSMTCQTLTSFDLQHEQEVYDNSLLTGYACCYNYQCKERYKINSDGPKFCPHCGQGLRLEQSHYPSVHDLFEALQIKGLVRRCDKIKYHNTHY